VYQTILAEIKWYYHLEDQSIILANGSDHAKLWG